MKKEKITVSTVLNNNLESIYAPLTTSTRQACQACLDVVKKVLDEEPRVHESEKIRCIDTLTKSVNKPSLFMSTLMTWISCIKVS